MRRPTTPTPLSLRFKEGLLIGDIADTQAKPLVRILFGGKSTVTELSRLEVREETLPMGAELSRGAMLVAVVPQSWRAHHDALRRA
jgi:hypothetical protein